jgi:thioredoxin 1
VIELVNSETFNKEITKPHIKLLVYFTAPWCGACKYVEKTIEELDKSEEFYYIKVLKVDIDQNPDLASRYNVRSIPTVLGIADGMVQATLCGSISKEDIVRKIVSEL